jgi:hypothetical protein
MNAGPHGLPGVARTDDDNALDVRLDDPRVLPGVPGHLERDFVFAVEATRKQLEHLRRRLDSARRADLTRLESVFGQIKSNRGIRRFQRRGRLAVLSEWRLLTLTHNLLKLHRHRLATA